MTTYYVDGTGEYDPTAAGTTKDPYGILKKVLDYEIVKKVLDDFVRDRDSSKTK